jgi:hypothetical protein
LKEWLRSGKRDRQAKKLFDEAATEIENELVRVFNKRYFSFEL